METQDARVELEEALQGRLRPWRWREYRGSRFTALVVARRVAGSEALWTVTDTGHAALLVTHAGDGVPWAFLVDHPAGLPAVRALADPRTPGRALLTLASDLDGEPDTESGTVGTRAPGRCHSLETPQPVTPTCEDPLMETASAPTHCDVCPDEECDEMRHGGTMCGLCGKYALGKDDGHGCVAA